MIRAAGRWIVTPGPYGRVRRDSTAPHCQLGAGAHRTASCRPYSLTATHDRPRWARQRSEPPDWHTRQQSERGRAAPSTAQRYGRRGCAKVRLSPRPGRPGRPVGRRCAAEHTAAMIGGDEPVVTRTRAHHPRAKHSPLLFRRPPLPRRLCCGARVGDRGRGCRAAMQIDANHVRSKPEHIR